jgi:hypothetical protein
VFYWKNCFVFFSKKDCQRNPPGRPIYALPNFMQVAVFDCSCSQPWQLPQEGYPLRGRCRGYYIGIAMSLLRKLSGLRTWPIEYDDLYEMWGRVGDRPGGLRWHPFSRVLDSARGVYIESKPLDSNCVREKEFSWIGKGFDQSQNIVFVFFMMICSFFNIMWIMIDAFVFLERSKNGFLRGSLHERSYTGMIQIRHVDISAVS